MEKEKEEVMIQSIPQYPSNVVVATLLVFIDDMKSVMCRISTVAPSVKDSLRLKCKSSTSGGLLYQLL